ncbi:MAG: sigma-70 family RNA polymerase sigma factor [Bacteroidales bacterium]|nr:sigma-70 family RNA polymerase sigma factor [Bacteroidales bacterium]
MNLLYSDRKIIEALQSTDDHKTDKAFRMLYQTYFRMAVQFVKSNSGEDDDAEDVFQDVLVSFYQNVRKGVFKGDSAIKTYLYAMIRNQWLVKLKKNKRSVNMEEPERAAESRHVLQRDSTSGELQRMVEGMLDLVSERCREVLKLYYFDNLSMTEIASRAGFDNENSAKTQKYKCMQRLIKLMAEKPELKEHLYELLAADE